jgi:hypothetical protein
VSAALNDCVDQGRDLAGLGDMSADGERRAAVSLDGLNDGRSVRLVAFVEAALVAGRRSVVPMRVYLSDTVLSHRTQFRRHSQKGAG